MIEMAYWTAGLKAETQWLSTLLDRITSRDIA